MTCEACASRESPITFPRFRIEADNQVYRYLPSRLVTRLKSERGSGPLLRLFVSHCMASFVALAVGKAVAVSIAGSVSSCISFASRAVNPEGPVGANCRSDALHAQLPVVLLCCPSPLIMSTQATRRNERDARVDKTPGVDASWEDRMSSTPAEKDRY
jgi:hypothetical protein